MSTIDIFAKVELFSELPTKDLTRLARLTVPRHFGPGEVIVKEGESAIAFYIVSKGKVEVVKGVGSKKETVLATMGPGDFFGEMALFDNHPRSASVRAVEDTEVLVLTKWDFNAELNTAGSRLAHSLLPILARRIRIAGEEATH